MLIRFKKKIEHNVIRPLFEQLKIDTYSRPSLYGLDKKLEKYLDYDGGTFLEVGANDGFKQSNTYYFEKIKNWNGILIEPIPFLFKKCRKLRSKSVVFNYICSSPEDSGKTRTIHYAGLMSQVTGAMGNPEVEEEHIRKGIENQNLKETFNMEIPCRTLSEIIGYSGFTRFDLMCIDVEGFEIQVLKGLILDKHAPEYLLVETWPHEEKEIMQYLSKHYEIEDKLTERDILFKLK